MRLRAERAAASRAVALASALLQTIASFPLAFGLAWFGMLFSDHAHALSSASDGRHLDLVLSHDAAPEAHDHGASNHLHGSPADDHVVHLASDEARDTRRTQPTALPVALASVRPMITAPRVAVALSPPIARPVPTFSRRSVVLRT